MRFLFVKRRGFCLNKVYQLCVVQTLERLSFYGLLSLLVIYFSHSAHLNDRLVYSLFAAFLVLSYMACLLGGVIADCYWGYKKTAVNGLILIAVGCFFIPLLGFSHIYLSLALVGCGIGLYEPNMSSLLGSFFANDQTKSTAAYTLLYIAVNIGSLLGITICAMLVKYVNYREAFNFIAIAATSAAIILFLCKNIKNHRSTSGDFLSNLFSYLAITVVISLSSFLLSYRSVLVFLLLVICGVSFFILKSAVIDADSRKKYFVTIFFIFLFNIIFIMLFMQNKTSLTMFSLREINRNFMGYTMPASMIQIFSPIFVIIIGPFMMKFWRYLSDKKIKIPVFNQYGVALTCAGIAFLILVVATNYYSGLEPLYVIIFFYLFITLSELIIGPVGLSTILHFTKKNKLSQVMGIWNFTFAIANYLAAKIAMVGSVDLAHLLQYHNDLDIYHHEFLIAAVVGMSVALISFLLALVVGYVKT